LAHDLRHRFRCTISLSGWQIWLWWTKNIDTKELERQRRKREQSRLRTRQKLADNACSDSDQANVPLADSDQADRQLEKTKPKIDASQIKGLKYFEKLSPLLERLHDDACDRDKANNRELHYDQYCMLILLYLFNPVVTSLRGIQQASELEYVQTKLGTSRASLGSLSEAASVFDAERLKEIIAELGAELKPLGCDSRFSDSRRVQSL
jgi:hypothetical protein